MADEIEDDFFLDFPCDNTVQAELENHTAFGEYDPCLPVLQDTTPAHSASWSKYLSGDVMAEDAGTMDGQSNNSLSPQTSYQTSDDIVIQKKECVVVGSRPLRLSEGKKKGNSHSKQAVAARENRQKKKQYVSDLETLVKTLKEENAVLHEKNSEQRQQLVMLQQEVSYLKGVITNDSALSTVLTTVLTNTTGIKRLSSSLLRDPGKSVSGMKSNDLRQESDIVSGQKCHWSQEESESGHDFPAERSKTNQITAQTKQPRLSLTIDRREDFGYQQQLRISQSEGVIDKSVGVPLPLVDKMMNSAGTSRNGPSPPDEQMKHKQVYSDSSTIGLDFSANNFSANSDDVDDLLHSSSLTQSCSVLNALCSFSNQSAEASYSTDHAYSKK